MTTEEHAKETLAPESAGAIEETAEAVEEATETVEETTEETVEETTETVEETAEETVEEATETADPTPGIHRVYQGTKSQHTGLVLKVLIFAGLCLLTAITGYVLGMNGPEKQFYYLVFATGEAVMTVLLLVMAVIFASHKGKIRESLYRVSIAAIPGVCVALILCNALTVIAALVHLGRTGVDETRIVPLLTSMVLRLICMECAHLCRKTVTGSVWALGRTDHES